MMYLLDMWDVTTCDREVRDCAAVDFGAAMLDLAAHADESCRLWVTDVRGRSRGVYDFDVTARRFVLACQTPYPAYWYMPDTDADFFDIDDEDIII